MERNDGFSVSQGEILLLLARQSISERFSLNLTVLQQKHLAEALIDICFKQKRGTFVTLTSNDQLRGCIGNLNPKGSVAEGVRQNAVNAAFNDHRFPTLTASELDEIFIEISVLTSSSPLNYFGSDELLDKLNPGVDGVVVTKDGASATFLPQVWDQLPKATDFLSHLCHKAGLPADVWMDSELAVETYQVQHFAE